MYEKITLPNGVRICHEKIPEVRSASLGIWVGSGSRYERAGESGASHFIEHMVFKGTNTRTAAELAELMDGVGGQTNAFTTKECTCFYGRTLDEHLDKLTDVLTDMFFNSRFDEQDVENERGVILEEIDMYKDTPEDLVAERLFTEVYKGSSLSRPILGTKRTLDKMTGEFLRQYMAAHYCPEETVVSLAGSFSQDDVKRLESIFTKMPEQKRNKITPAAYAQAFTLKKKNIEQNHLCLGFPGMSVCDDRRYTSQLMSSILGGGMSSRLFQTVREKLGLCYTVYTFSSAYAETGAFCVYTALGKESEDTALEAICTELIRFCEDGVTEQELARAREQAKANVLMGLESTGARMQRIGKNELYLNRVPELDEIIEQYNSVTREGIRTLAQECLNMKNVSFSAVGKIGSEDKYKEILERFAAKP